VAGLALQRLLVDLAAGELPQRLAGLGAEDARGRDPLEQAAPAADL